MLRTNEVLGGIIEEMRTKGMVVFNKKAHKEWSQFYDGTVN